MNKRHSVKRYYQDGNVVARYDAVRFEKRGGAIVDDVEKGMLLKMLRDHPKDEFILEVASGTGRFTSMLSEKGYRIVAVDSSLEMLKQSRRTVREKGYEVFCVCGDAFRLPFKKGVFKGAYSIRFVWHFASQKELINAIMEVCRGYFVFDVMNRRSLAAVTAPIANRIVYRLLFTSLTTSKKMTNFFREKRYHIVESMSGFFFPFIFYRTLPRISHLLHRLDMLLLHAFSEGSLLYYKITKN